MTKDRRDRSVSSDRFRASPLRCSSSRPKRSFPKIPSETEENIKEWEDARCPVCMEHPHNAVLLICASHDKGCRPYMCDTSYRHSNCLDQFRKSFAGTSSAVPQQDINLSVDANLSPGATLDSTIVDAEEIIERPATVSLGDPGPIRWTWDIFRETGAVKTGLSALPDLRKHARLEHPLVRPSEADPERQRNWRRMERQRDIGDLISTLQSSFSEDRNDEDAILPMEDRGVADCVFPYKGVPTQFKMVAQLLGGGGSACGGGQHLITSLDSQVSDLMFRSLLSDLAIVEEDYKETLFWLCLRFSSLTVE
ncbi:hypothetical protein NL676_033276 [Syzygium grande]|nr:hypothetical protein NL676_033276 [Syzygium grande]